MSGLGFIFITYDITESKSMTTGTMIIEVLPYLLLGQIWGVFSDLLPKIRLMVIIDILRGLLLFVTFILAWLGDINYIVLLVIVFLNQLGGVFFNPASKTLVPTLVDKEQLTSANSIISISQNISSLIALALVALIITIGDNKSIHFLHP